MPCRVDGPFSDEESGYPRLLEAAMCAILRRMDANGEIPSFLSSCDWDEAGVTKAELLGWWARHKREDAKRRRREQEAAETKKQRDAALKKLSPRERRALGL